MQHSNDTTSANELIQSSEDASADAQAVSGQADSRDAAAGFQDALKNAESAAQEHHDAWLRAKAETENVRKRAQLDIASAHKYATENFAGALLEVKDSLEASLTVRNITLESLKSGVELTLKQLAAAFDKFNVVEINPLGEKFDPHQHQAISMIEADAAPNTVVQVMQKGYRLHDRVLRPALVAVAKAKDA